MDDVTWAALTLTLTAVGGVLTWLALTRRGLAAGLRVGAFALLPLAAFLTDTLQMFTRIGSAVSSWVVNLALNPIVWTGIGVFGVSMVLFVVSGYLRARELGGAPAAPGRVTPGTKDALPRSRGSKGAPAIDDDLADIEALLRQRGIS